MDYIIHQAGYNTIQYRLQFLWKPYSQADKTDKNSELRNGNATSNE